jgi:thiamine transport system permease protein
VLAVFFVLPVAGMLSRGLWVDGRLDVGGLVEVLVRPRVSRVLWFTIWSSTVATGVTLMLGLPVAFALHRLALPGRRALRAAVMVPFVLPTVVVGVAFRTLLSASGPLGWLGLDGSAAAIVAAMVFFNLAVVVRTVGPLWEGLDRRREDAAAALGASPWQVLITVTLPSLGPGIAAAATVVFLFCSTSFGIVLTLGGLRYSTVETEIYLLTTQFLDLRAASALSLLQVLVVVTMLVLAARAQADRSAPSDRAPQSARRPAGRHLPVLAVTAGVLVFLAAPLVSLVVRSLRVDGHWALRNYELLTAIDPRSAALVPVSTALVNSLRVAVDATVLAVALGGLIAAVVSRVPRSPGERRFLWLLDGVFLLPLGVSAVTLGFGLLLTLDRPPLDLLSSPLLLPTAQAMVALPLVVRTLAPALRSIDDRQRQAAASLGASPLRVALSIDLPVSWRPLLAAIGFAFAVSLGEFGATSFLTRADRPTLPVLIYQLLSRPGADSVGMALAGSVVLATVTVAVMAAVERLRPDSGRVL